jgi:fatty-acyl-CoA synthase
MVFPDSLYVERLVKRLEISGNRICLRHSGRDIAAGDFLNSIHRYAGALDSLSISISRGDVVALLAPNHPDALALR